MSTKKSKLLTARIKAPSPPGAGGTLDLKTGNPLEIDKMVRAGFPFSHLAAFQRATKLPWDLVEQLVSIPERTRTRRQSEGRLHPDESDRVWRASRIFDMAVKLFEGDADAARTWLQSPQVGLGGEVPLALASTEVGAREVETLIGRLEYGIFA